MWETSGANWPRFSWRVAAPALNVKPSRQRYECAGEHWRYVDLGAAKGVTAVLAFDEHGIVRHYEGLFEAL